jgi:photosystem II stability/assembly factor-like uncharacterized protein
MKKRFITFFISIVFINASAQWVHLSPGTSADFWSVYFTGSKTGYAAGDSGIILKTIDGGTTWSRQISGTSEILRSVRFANNNKGVIVGNKGVILTTINGGADWSKQVSGTEAGLWSVFLADTLAGFAVGDNGIILKTSNGGVTWDKQASGTNYNLKAVCFTDTSRGYVTGTNMVLKTNNGGKSWIDCSPGLSSYQYHAISFIDSLAGYVGGFDWSLSLPGNYYPVILKTINGGIDWINANCNRSMGFVRAFYFIDRNRGYASGGSSGGPFPSCRILKTNDGGATWTGQFLDSCYVGLHCIFYADSLTGYAAGERGIILKTMLGGDTHIHQVSKNSAEFRIFPNPADNIITVEKNSATGDNCLTIYNINGLVVFQSKFTQNPYQISLNHLPAGIYLIKLTDKYCTEVKKLSVSNRF